MEELWEMIRRALKTTEGEDFDGEFDDLVTMWWEVDKEDGSKESRQSTLVYLSGHEPADDNVFRLFMFGSGGRILNYAEGNASRFLPEGLWDGYSESGDKQQFLIDNIDEITDFLSETGLFTEVGIIDSQE